MPLPDVVNGSDQAAWRRSEEGASFGAWTLVWTLVGMKVATIGVVVLAARQGGAGTLFALITWHWVVVLAVLVAGPLLFRYRLRRVRARRTRLLRAEWMLDEEPSARPPATPLPCAGEGVAHSSRASRK